MELLGGIHPSSPFYNEDVERYDVDLDKARSLLYDAGYGDGLDLRINYIPGPNEQQRNEQEAHLVRLEPEVYAARLGIVLEDVAVGLP